ncbi:MAG: DUF4160 domain-containing protein [Dehalococcoidia bacterium]
MPELARFDGMVITMNFGDHAPPHLHVRFAGLSASVTISPLTLAEGDLPASVWRKVRDWAAGREEELLQVWQDLGGASARD